MNRIDRIELHDLSMPLKEPYPSAIATLTALDTLLVVVHTSEGALGFGEAAIVEGYTHETRRGGWDFCSQQAQEAVGQPAAVIIDALLKHRAEHSHAVAALVSAIEMALLHPVLGGHAEPLRVPLLAPVNAKTPERIADEVRRLLDEGFRTLKVKVGFEVAKDLQRLGWIRDAVQGRASIRLDGNQGYSLDQALAFVQELAPEGIELFEQPCKDDDWDAAVAVARASPVPMMLDESIYVATDIDRAAQLQASEYIKLKLVKSGGLSALMDDLQRITRHGMKRVLGNGVASEVGCWMEACVAHRFIDNAGEFNGFLKPEQRLFQDPLQFAEGCIQVPVGFWPTLNMQALKRFRTAHALFEKGTA